MTPLPRRRLVALGSAFLLAACSLPRGAANGEGILSSAARDENADYAVYAVTANFIDRVAHWPSTGTAPRGNWLSGGGGRASTTIRPGDTLSLVVWDNTETSLLAATGARQVPLSQITVAPDGKIFVPYLDRVHVAGMSPETARMEIQEKLTLIAPSAQVQLSSVAGRNNSVDLIGGVGTAGTFPLTDGSMTVLNLIALGGGVSETLPNPIVRLSRGGAMYVTSLDRLYENPALDTVLQGGDRVIVEADDRSFIALGAAGKEQITPFPNDRPSALDAMASVGGVNDSRGDPKAILVLRQYPRTAVADGLTGPEAERTIFVIDLTSADGLFSARKFGINPDDVVYVSESPITAFKTVSQLIGSVFGLANTVDSSVSG
jgi:polysaccharide export outer membrane protein